VVLEAKGFFGVDLDPHQTTSQALQPHVGAMEIRLEIRDLIVSVPQLSPQIDDDLTLVLDSLVERLAIQVIDVFHPTDPPVIGGIVLCPRSGQFMVPEQPVEGEPIYGVTAYDDVLHVISPHMTKPR
jgi:hypothetical protein